MCIPFIKKIETRNNKYIYDVSTNTILKCNDIEYDIVDNINSSNYESAFKEFATKYEKEALSQAINNIQNVREGNNIFSGKKSKGLKTWFCEEHKDKSKSTRQLILETTEQCNLRCKYCVFSGLYDNQRVHNDNYMSLVTAEKATNIFLEHSKDAKEVFICFYGGEPLLNMKAIKHVVSLVEKKLGKKDHTFFVDTNGTLLKGDTLDYLLEHNFSFQISIDGPQIFHDRNRVYKDNEPTFSEIINNIKEIQRRDKKYLNSHLSIAVTLVPPYKIQEIKNYFDKNFADISTISVNFVNQLNCDFENIFSEELKDSNLKNELDALKSLFIEEKSKNNKPIKSAFLQSMFQKELVRIHKRSLSDIPEYEHPNGTCTPGYRRLFVTANGKFYACERMGNSWELGNINTGIDEEKIQQLIDTYINYSQEECKNCWAVRLCGICFTSAIVNDNFDSNMKNMVCELERTSIHEALKTYSEIMEKNDKSFDYIKEMVFE